MTFKKKKIIITKQKKTPVFFSYLFWIIWIGMIFFLGLSTLAYVSDIDFKWLQKIGALDENGDISEDKQTEDKKAEEKREKELIEEKEKLEEGKINILVVGRWGGNHDAPNLTDTIILASLNTETEIVSMLSIPRDLYIEYSLGNEWKLNWLYEESYSESESLNLAMKDLEIKVEEITWEKIDYYVNLDFKWFIELIDTVGWIEVEVPENFVDYEYPDNNDGYTTFILRKWTWTLDGDVALKYARSRHSTSDFDRSLRQQTIIGALKEKMVSLDYLTSPTKLSALYSNFQKNIKTDIPLTKMISLALTAKGIENDNILSSNMNDSCFFWEEKCEKWGFLYYPRKDLFWWVSVLLPEWAINSNLWEYTILQEYSDIVFNKNSIFTDQIPINIFNWTSTLWIASELAYDLTRFGFNIPDNNSVWNVENKTWEKSIILYNRILKDNITLLELQKRTWFPARETILPEVSTNGNVKIEIILADDYLEKNGGI